MAVGKTGGAAIGGTHITAALVDLKNGALLPDTPIRQHVDARGNKMEVISSWAQDIQKQKTAGAGN